MAAEPLPLHEPDDPRVFTGEVLGADNLEHPVTYDTGATETEWRAWVTRESLDPATAARVIEIVRAEADLENNFASYAGYSAAAANTGDGRAVRQKACRPGLDRWYIRGGALMLRLFGRDGRERAGWTDEMKAATRRFQETPLPTAPAQPIPATNTKEPTPIDHAFEDAVLQAIHDPDSCGWGE